MGWKQPPGARDAGRLRRSPGFGNSLASSPGAGHLGWAVAADATLSRPGMVRRHFVAHFRAGNDPNGPTRRRRVATGPLREPGRRTIGGRRWAAGPPSARPVASVSGAALGWCQGRGTGALRRWMSSGVPPGRARRLERVSEPRAPVRGRAAEGSRRGLAAPPAMGRCHTSLRSPPGQCRARPPSATALEQWSAVLRPVRSPAATAPRYPSRRRCRRRGTRPSRRASRRAASNRGATSRARAPRWRRSGAPRQLPRHAR